MASEMALMDFDLPTKRGDTIYGNTTISRKGNRGSVMGE